MPGAGASINNANSDNIIFTIEDTNLYIPIVTLSAKDKQKLSKVLTKLFEKPMYWKEDKTKSENKDTTNEHRYFLRSNLVGVNRLFMLIYSNEDNNTKKYKARRYYLPKGIIKNYNVIINGKNFYDQIILIKRYKEIRKLRTGKDEDYTAGCLLDYDYFENVIS